MTSSKPNGAWSAIEAALRAFAKYHAPFACLEIQWRRGLGQRGRNTPALVVGMND